MKFRVRATWRRQDGIEVGVADDIEAGDACEALLAAWPVEGDRPVTHASITIEPAGLAGGGKRSHKQARTAPRHDSRLPAGQDARYHAAALLAHLQAGLPGAAARAGATAALAYPAMRGAYDDMIAERGWLPAPWMRLSREFRLLTGSRKRYINGEAGKVLMFDVPLTAPEIIGANQKASACYTASVRRNPNCYRLGFPALATCSFSTRVM